MKRPAGKVVHLMIDVPGDQRPVAQCWLTGDKWVMYGDKKTSKVAKATCPACVKGARS